MADIKQIKIKGTAYNLKDDSKLSINGGELSGNLTFINTATVEPKINFSAGYIYSPSDYLIIESNSGKAIKLDGTIYINNIIVPNAQTLGEDTLATRSWVNDAIGTVLNTDF